ncbi:MAG: BMC domain-containing protein [Butyricicoccus pullicaecorum]|nr:BMC domain-containing protein [Butyricicoccus pullicaecorum]MBS5165853.1 BMC domain-containing protein [Butyricicoccus pullicaecorum]MDO4669394.1 BMC domain-containing protein [Butyricicoccus pullicaecorum]
MATAIGMVELSSIARGIETCDYMVKAATVELLRASTVCPGKYMIIIAGDTGDVRASMAEGCKRGGEMVVDTLMLPNAHEQLIPAISMTNQVEAGGAVGVLEFYSIASAIVAADVAVKAASVTLIEVRTGYAIGGKGFVTLTGDVGAVRAAVEAARKEAELLVETTVIPRPDKKLFDALL